MTEHSALASAIDATNRSLTDPERNITIGADAPQFELYHFALSLCSQKVRATLMEKGASFRAHDINLSLPHLGNYDPDYVNLRLMGHPGGEFARGYTGRSSVETEGFDPAVVPTLADLEGGDVVTDSARICRHIDRQVTTGSELIPNELEGEILFEIKAVDDTPHVALLYGAHPEIDYRPAAIRKNMTGVFDRKIEKLRMAHAQAADAHLVQAALEAKIAKEEAARDFVATPDDMRRVVEEVVGITAALETRLSDGRPFVTGDTFTLADIVWAVSLFRFKWLGMAFLWEGGHALNAIAHPHAERYGAMLFDRPAFRASCIDWPKVPRSEYVADHYPD